MARVCVELDLLKEKVEEIILEFDDTSHAQKIIYERIPDYCTHCKHIGHSIEGCYMIGNINRPPPPARRPTPTAGSDGYELNGLSGNMGKSRGTLDNSKISRAENPNPTWGAQKVVAQNQDWIKVKKKGPREMGLAGLDNGIPIKKRTAFSNKNDNLVVKSDNLAEEHASWNGQIGLENGVITPSAVSGSPKCLNHSIHILSSFEKNKNTPGLNIGAAHAFDETFRATKECPLDPPSLNLQTVHSSRLDIIPIEPQILSDNKEIIGQNRSSSRNLNMVEIVGDNIINGSDFIMDLAVGVLKGDNFGALPEKIPPTFSIPATPLEGFISQLDTSGNWQGPTPTTLHTKKLIHAQHNLDFDTINNIGPIPLPSSREMAIIVVGPHVFLSPLNKSAPITNLDPPHHLPSTAVDTPCPDEGSRATLGLHLCCLYEAQTFSKTPPNSQRIEDRAISVNLFGLRPLNPIQIYR
ncbi:hypothetical protein DH2020_021719 [Rehmannia glutinosa]|uniref:Uncharacterized protein n=1 Tax=Rehmannia glutinosa TaxID=99300 RepID=A0ABR0WEZ5_REHGL